MGGKGGGLRSGERTKTKNKGEKEGRGWGFLFWGRKEDSPTASRRHAGVLRAEFSSHVANRNAFPSALLACRLQFCAALCLRKVESDLTTAMERDWRDSTRSRQEKTAGGEF